MLRIMKWLELSSLRNCCWLEYGDKEAYPKKEKGKLDNHMTEIGKFGRELR